MRINRSLIIPKGEPVVLHVTCKVARKAFAFRCKRQRRRYNPRKVCVETVLYKLVTTFRVELFGFNCMDNHQHFALGFDPGRISALSDREVIESACDLDVLSRKRGRFTEEERAEWIEERLAQPEEVAKWRANFSDPSVFMKYLNQAVSLYINKLDDQQGTLWKGRFHSTRCDDPKGLLAAMMYVDLNKVRAGSAGNLEDSVHSSIYYRMVDVNRLPTHEREHALKMRGILCPLPEVFRRCGWDVEGPTLNEYIEMLVIEGCKRRKGKHCLNGDPKGILERYGLRTGWMSEEGLAAFRMCRTVVGSPESIAKAGRKLGKRWNRQIEAARKIFCEPPESGSQLTHP